MITLNSQEMYRHSKSWWNNQNVEDVTIIQEDLSQSFQMDFNTAKHLLSSKGAKGISFERMVEIASMIKEKKIRLNEFNTKAILKAEIGKTKNTEELLENYRKIGTTKCLLFGSDWTKEAIVEQFNAIPKYRGRVPQILDSMASASDTYRLSPEEIVQKFDLQLVKDLKTLGLPEANIVLLYTKIQKHDIERMMNNPARLEKIVNLLSKGILKDEDKLIHAAKWVSKHPETEEDLLELVLDNPTMFKINEESSVEKVRVQSGTLDALSEIKKIEKAYKKPKFKFSECQCNLRFSEASTNRYVSYILKGDDPRQVMLGYETHCCQVLGDAGETAMLHGLLNPKAGFWGVFDKDTEKLRCQAEIWEFDEDTLVFDNIEFADDTELSRYQEIIGEWLVSSPYKNICMGLGWNSMADSSFQRAPDFTPPVTARELYVMSYEEDAELPNFEYRTARNKSEMDNAQNLMRIPNEETARDLLDAERINYYDYLYADVDDRKGIVYLKENYRVADYFEVPLEKQQLFETQFLKDSKEGRLESYQTVIGEFLSKRKEVELEER